MNTEIFRKKLKEGLNCSQTIILHYQERYGLDRRQAKAMAEAFGGGMAQGDICGAVTGAYMVLGLEYGSGDEDSRALTKEKVKIFNQQFIERMGSLKCEGLLGANISTKEGKKIVRADNRMEEICPKALLAAVEILDEMMGKA